MVAALSTIRQNVELVRERIAEAAIRSGRSPESVVLVAAAKGVGAERVEEAIACGIAVIGENKVQEALAKFEKVSLKADWHMIGHLQTNKVGKALSVFSTVQSVDSERLAREINSRAEEAGKKVDVLIEVNTGLEPSKFGLEPEGVIEAVDSARRLPFLNVTGLMTLGLMSDDPEAGRSCFRLLADIRMRCIEHFGDEAQMKHLSMGMSDSFEIAIEEGSNMVRVGRALFGPRKVCIEGGAA